MTTIVEVRNVNEAIDRLRKMMGNTTPWVGRTARGSYTQEWHEPVMTVYGRPQERVSFSVARDANPFFHLFESLWILAGRNDVGFLQIFNKKMGDYSDDGRTFHAPYGWRLRTHFREEGSDTSRNIDQLKLVVQLLRQDIHTRRAVMSIWDPVADLAAESKDIPCNDMIMFKYRDSQLDMLVCCRSNDAIWGAYGANVVQFSMIHEFVAAAIGIPMGVYRQLSDSFHYYPAIDVCQRMFGGHDWNCDPYDKGEYSERNTVTTFPLFGSPANADDFLQQCERLCHDIEAREVNSEGYMDFFQVVAIPMWIAWSMYRTTGVRSAVEFLNGNASRIDWLEAGARWLTRRIKG